MESGRGPTYFRPMSDGRQTTQQKLDQHSEALDNHERQKRAAPLRIRSTPPAPPAGGPGIRAALRTMRWGLWLFWALWLLLVWFTQQPHSTRDLLLALFFSGAVLWLWYQFHKAILIWAVKKLSPRPKPSQEDR